MRGLFLPVLFLASRLLAAAPGDPASQVNTRLAAIEQALEQWQFATARRQAEQLLHDYPDLPAVQLAAAWVKHHFGEHAAARQLAERAVAALGPGAAASERVRLIRAAAELEAGYRRARSPDGRVEVSYAPGTDEILVPLLFRALGRTLEVVGEDLGHRPEHAVLVELLPGRQALSRLTGLSEQAIETSGTIAVCKFGRLLVTSPRVTLQGYSWLDTASHELVHLLIAQKTLNNAPIWLHEALAHYEEHRWRRGEPFSREGPDPLPASRLSRAIRSGQLITFEQMHPSMALLPSREATELAFAEVYQAAEFLRRRVGYPGIRRLLEALGRGLDDSQALFLVTGMNRRQFVAAWMKWMKAHPGRELKGDPLDLSGGQRRAAAERALGRRGNLALRDRLHLGELLRARGRLAASLVEYQRAVRQAGPRHVASWLLNNKLGQALLQAGKQRRAQDAFAASLEINPVNLEAHLQLGRLLIDSEPYQAWLHLREAERINPLDPRVQQALLKACRSLAQGGDRHQDWSEETQRHRRALELLAANAVRRQAPGGTAPQPKPAASGAGAVLRIHSRPWAKVWLDYRDTGLTTPLYRLEVTPGVHLLGLQADCLPQPLVTTVTVAAGEEKLIDLELCPEAEGAGEP